ncbi:MAG: sigma 54-interacting transcriptional regulator [Duodenibacillus sp.]|nr:sigma 54-interacting transcriptional regulator [Duodenibacillus sp.]
MLNALSEPAILIRPEDMTVAAVNKAFTQVFGALAFEGRRCWETLHRSKSCMSMGLDCPLQAAVARSCPASCTQTLYTNVAVQHVHVQINPVFASDGTIKFWLERFAVEQAKRSATMTTALVGTSREHQRVLSELQSVAGNAVSVFLYGERGLGKENYARALHENGTRASRSFVVLVGKALSAATAETALFGRALNSDGSKVRPGLLAQARGGTLFIHEVANLSLAIQEKLVEVLRNGLFWPIGAQEPVVASFRVIASSEHAISTLVQAKKILPEFARLISEVTIQIPPLRSRPEDVESLAQTFARLNVPSKRFSEKAVEELKQRDWLGNVSELSEYVAELAQRVSSDVIELAEVLGSLDNAETARQSIFMPGAPILPLDQMKDLYIGWALQVFPGSRADLAKRLGMSERTLYRLASSIKPVGTNEPKE